MDYYVFLNQSEVEEDGRSLNTKEVIIEKAYQKRALVMTTLWIRNISASVKLASSHCARSETRVE